jgi:uncharacterized membrane protein
MEQADKTERVCGVCGQHLPAEALVPVSFVREPVAALIRADHPDWDSSRGFVCRADLNRYRSRYVERMLEAERGELSDVEREVLAKIEKAELVARNVDAEFDTRLSLGDRVADRVASFGGSWRFIFVFGVVLTAWILLNVVVLVRHPPDPYPFILLNLVLSCLAAIQAPVIMMSQNRQEAKDRVRSEHDYKVNLKAELEIRSLHEKMDHLMLKQWQRLLEIQEIQVDLMRELSDREPDVPAQERMRQDAGT